MKVIRNIFKENFEKQKKNIGNLISANFKITIEEIKKSQKEIKNMGKEICDLRSSLKFPENVLEEKVNKLEERCYEWVSEFLSLSHTKKLNYSQVYEKNKKQKLLINEKQSCV